MHCFFFFSACTHSFFYHCIHIGAILHDTSYRLVRTVARARCCGHCHRHYCCHCCFFVDHLLLFAVDVLCQFLLDVSFLCCSYDLGPKHSLCGQSCCALLGCHIFMSFCLYVIGIDLASLYHAESFHD